MQLQPGDAIVFPHGNANSLSSQQHRAEGGSTITAAPASYPETVKVGSGEGVKATFVCGFLGGDLRPYDPLLASLPPRLIIHGTAGDWLTEFPRQVVAESTATRPGSTTMLTRMAELMFVEVVRRHIASLDATHSGWLRGLGDAIVGPALRVMHDRPEHHWSLVEIAQSVGAPHAPYSPIGSRNRSDCRQCSTSRIGDCSLQLSISPAPP